MRPQSAATASEGCGLQSASLRIAHKRYYTRLRSRYLHLPNSFGPFMMAHLSYRMTLGKAHDGGGVLWKSLSLWEARATGSRAHSLCSLPGLHQILAVQTLKPLLRFQKHTTSPHPKPCPHAHPVLAETGAMHRVETEVMQGNPE